MHNLSANLENHSPEDLDPSDYNLRLIGHLSLIRNNKGYTALNQSVDQGNFPLFRLLLDLCHFHDTQSPPPQQLLMPTLMSSQCAKLEESPLLKALRMPSTPLELSYSLLHVATTQGSYYESVCKQVEGVSKRNILHLAVIGKQRELIEVIVH